MDSNINNSVVMVLKVQGLLILNWSYLIRPFILKIPNCPQMVFPDFTTMQSIYSRKMCSNNTLTFLWQYNSVSLFMSQRKLRLFSRAAEGSHFHFWRCALSNTSPTRSLAHRSPLENLAFADPSTVKMNFFVVCKVRLTNKMKWEV